MALDDILAAIRDETEQQIEVLGAEAQARVATILDRARAESADVETRETHARDRLAQRDADRTINQARLVVDRRLRETRENIYREANQATAARLAALRDSSDYPDLLGRLLDESRAALPRGTTVRIDAADAAVMEQLLRQRGAASSVVADLQTMGGLELDTGDGRRVANTLETRLARAEPQLRSLAGSMIPDLRSEPS